jgi:hypothetical protein
MATTRLAALAALVLLSMVAAGCGTALDDAGTEDTVRQYLEDEIGQKVASIDCPSGVDVEPDETFDCDVRLKDGTDETVTLRILNEDADLAVADIQPEKSDTKSAK